MPEFKIPPVSTLIGGTWKNFIRTLRGNKVEPRHYIKILLTGLSIIIFWPFRVYERFSFRKKLKNYESAQDLIFIIDHWRSGTTHLHSTLCQAESASYLTTYYSVFPYYVKSKWLFKKLMKAKNA